MDIHLASQYVVPTKDRTSTINMSLCTSCCRPAIFFHKINLFFFFLYAAIATMFVHAVQASQVLRLVAHVTCDPNPGTVQLRMRGFNSVGMETRMI
jgi:hypothetical protein